jgi:exonuclease VII small subunit
MNTSFSSPGFESNSNFYNLDWSNRSDFSWHAHATKNYAPQVDELHHPDYLQFDNQFSSHSSYDYPPKQSSLEETLKEFMEFVSQPTILASHELSLEDTLEAFRKTVNQPCQKIIDATMANTEAVVRLEGSRTKNSTCQLHESFVIKWLCKCECRTHRELGLSKINLKCLN